MSAPRSLITGITGQDGSYLAELLLEQGHDVVGLVRPGRTVTGLDVELVEADIGDVEGFSAAVRAARAERLYHLAAPTFVPRSWEDPAQTMHDIAGGTGTVLHLARDLGMRLLTVASPEIFGDAWVSPQVETSPKHPRSPYGVAKLAGHELVRVMRSGQDLHASSAITYNHESPRRPERFVTRKITRGAAAIKLGLQQELALGDLNAKRDWSHARDIVRGYALMLDQDAPDDYILASGVARTVGDFVAAAFGALGLDARDYVRVDPQFLRPPEATTYVGDPTLARERLGWEPRIAFEDLVREMVEHDVAELRAAT